MADPTVLIGFGDEQFTLSGIKVQEMAKVQSWTSFKNRREWFQAISDEDATALIAAYLLVKHRKGEKTRWEDVNFDLDDLTAKFIDGTGREIEPVLEKKPDGALKTDKDGQPIPVLKDGKAQWVYTDSGEPVPPTTPTA